MLHYQQVTLLRCLVRHHGLKTIHVEGMGDDGRQAWQERIKGLKEMLADEPLHRGLVAAGKLEQAARDALADIRKERLHAGAAGVLEAMGVVRTLPLEPFAVPLKDTAGRDRIIVKRLLGVGPCTVATLGGGDDLSDELERQATGAEYLRVELLKYVDANRNR
jgi:hypothetical protein